MALSDRERRLLAEMEAALASDDPRLQSTLSGSDTQTLIKKAPGSLLAGASLILAGIAILFGGLIAQLTPLGVVGFIVALAGVLMVIRSVGVKSPRVARSSRSLGDRLQDRWDQRNS
jgi:F0F1-type ATP synthase assembly protein I